MATLRELAAHDCLFLPRAALVFVHLVPSVPCLIPSPLRLILLRRPCAGLSVAAHE